MHRGTSSSDIAISSWSPHGGVMERQKAGRQRCLFHDIVPQSGVPTRICAYPALLPMRPSWRSAVVERTQSHLDKYEVGVGVLLVI